MNTCVVCLGTVTLDDDGALVLVGESFTPPVEHTHRVALSIAA